MADMLSETDRQINVSAHSISVLLKEHNGQDVSLLDLRGLNNWTDFFVIATATSKTHMDGMDRFVKEYCRNNDIEVIGSSRKDQDETWRLIDLGSIIVHLMTAETREFYELERLWRPITQSGKPCE